MKKKSNIKLFFLSLITIILSSIAYFFSTGFYDIWFLAWIAPLPILLFSLYEFRMWRIILITFLAYFLGSLNFLYYLPTLLPVKPLISGAIFTAFIFSFIILFSAYSIRKTKKWWTLFLFPTLLVIKEFLISLVSSAGTLDSIAYSQMKFLPIVQIASITGIWGIVFILGFFPSTLAVLWHFKKNKAQITWGLIVFFTVMVFVLGFGSFRLLDSKQTSFIKVGLLAAPESVSDLLTTNEERAKSVVELFLKEVPKLKKEGAEIIIMPEKIVKTEPFYEEEILNLFKQSALENKVMLVFSLAQLKDTEKLNTAFVISEKGQIIEQYHKQHLLPGAEAGYIPGKELKTFYINDKLIGVIICKDADFINPALKYSQKGVGVLIIPALDFRVDGWLHAKPAIMRGIEGGYSVVRAAQWGLLTISDKYGRILAKKETSASGVVSIVAKTPVYSGKTFYSQFGNWFVWLCIAGFVLLGSVVLIRKK